MARETQGINQLQRACFNQSMESRKRIDEQKSSSSDNDSVSPSLSQRKKKEWKERREKREKKKNNQTHEGDNGTESVLGKNVLN